MHAGKTLTPSTDLRIMKLFPHLAVMTLHTPCTCSQQAPAWEPLRQLSPLPAALSPSAHTRLVPLCLRVLCKCPLGSEAFPDHPISDNKSLTFYLAYADPHTTTKPLPSFILHSILLSWNALYTFLLLLFSCLVVSDSLLVHGLQHTRPSCPSPSPEVCSDSYPLSW